MEIQRLLGSDIVMAFDELVPTTSTRDVQADAMERSMRWARRSRDAFLGGGEHAERAAQFGIQQGALDRELRRVSAERLIEIGFDGYAVGGLAVGEGQEAMFDVLDYAPGQLPADKPRYLMGVGKPDDIVGAVERGIDMFDCVLPTRSGRDGAGIHLGRARSTSAMRALPRIRGRSIRRAAAQCARPGAAPISITLSARAKSWAPC